MSETLNFITPHRILLQSGRITSSYDLDKLGERVGGNIPVKICIIPICGLGNMNEPLERDQAFHKLHHR